MKILMFSITPLFPDHDMGGGQKHLRTIAMHLAQAGHEITLLSTRQYASTERLQIARETAQVVNVGALSREVSIGDQEFYQTQYGLLRAQALAERVARDLGLVDDPAFFRMFHKGKDFAANSGAAGRAARNAIASDILLARIEIAPEQLPRLIEAGVRDAVAARLKELGFRFVAVDLEGFRSGSLNVLVPEDMLRRTSPGR